ncbi:hypothetical protein EIP91_001134 [Steccherinum ochraceum]|uniref:Uncharacterized protein n=1 Tax=Steccherinum ochraceum TaxID=92696 RepID=A0A4R0RV80_9APHY|nr:hypothetical protein EIP91_001134 [Steccherinum ochraceum]
MASMQPQQQIYSPQGGSMSPPPPQHSFSTPQRPPSSIQQYTPPNTSSPAHGIQSYAFTTGTPSHASGDGMFDMSSMGHHTTHGGGHNQAMIGGPDLYIQPTPSHPRQPSPLALSIFVDTVASSFNLDTESRQMLHGFSELGQGLSGPDISMRVFALAASLSLIQEQRKTQLAYDDLNNTFADMRVQMDLHFKCNEEQKENIRLRAGEMLLEPDRVTFMKLFLDLKDDIWEHRASMSMAHVIGNPAREKSLLNTMRSVCSSVRNGFREIVRDSVIGTGVTCLNTCLMSLVKRFHREGVAAISARSVLGRSEDAKKKVVLFRRFALDHPALLNRADPEEENSDPEPQAAASEANSATSEQPKKRKRNGTVGNAAKGEDFWSQLELWFIALQEKHGDSFSSPGWQTYITECLKRDEEQFPPL